MNIFNYWVNFLTTLFFFNPNSCIFWNRPEILSTNDMFHMCLHLNVCITVINKIIVKLFAFFRPSRLVFRTSSITRNPNISPSIIQNVFSGYLYSLLRQKQTQTNQTNSYPQLHISQIQRRVIFIGLLTIIMNFSSTHTLGGPL